MVMPKKRRIATGAVRIKGLAYGVRFARILLIWVDTHDFALVNRWFIKRFFSVFYNKNRLYFHYMPDRQQSPFLLTQMQIKPSLWNDVGITLVCREKNGANSTGKVEKKISLTPLSTITSGVSWPPSAIGYPARKWVFVWNWSTHEPLVQLPCAFWSAADEVGRREVRGLRQMRLQFLDKGGNCVFNQSRWVGWCVVFLQNYLACLRSYPVLFLNKGMI